MAAAAPGAPGPPLMLMDLPAAVQEKFCRIMDCLSETDWMRFASEVISDQTELMTIKARERTGASVTRELWLWWGQRAGTVQDLLLLLESLELYRARNVIQNWYRVSFPHSNPASSDDFINGKKALDIPEPNTDHGAFISPDSTSPSNSSERRPVQCLPGPPSPPESLLHSLRSSCISSVVSPETGVRIPEQESCPMPLGCSPLWSQEELKQATNGFSEGNIISSGDFACVYRGQRGQSDFAVKKLNLNSQCSRQQIMEMFLHSEIQVCLRCRHKNVLRLLGCCVEDDLICLVYPYMLHGSLDRVLEQPNAEHLLTWEKRVAISLGLLDAVLHLHKTGILHGNIKSSNVLLDENFIPKLGHSCVRFNRKTDYTHMTTTTSKSCHSYLPNEYIRSRLLTEEVDVFSCGIVLAEMLTGQKAMAGGSDMYLKDIILEELRKAKESLRLQKMPVNEYASSVLCAKELVVKYLYKTDGHLPEEAAVLFATAICMCLKKKKATAYEIYTVMEKVELQRQYDLGRVQKTGLLSVNYPEETDDDSFMSEYSTSGAHSPKYTGAVALSHPEHMILVTESLRVPCESDESEPFCILPPGGQSDHYLPFSEPPSSGSEMLRESQGPIGVHVAYRNGCSVEGEGYSDQVNAISAALDDSQDISSTSNMDERGASGAELVKMNRAKEKMMEKIQLYQDDQIDSSQMFSMEELGYQ